MDYEEFKKRIGDEMDVPDEEQKNALINSVDSVHLVIGIGYYFGEDDYVSRDIIPDGELFIRALDLLDKRDAIRGKDYILTCHTRNHRIICSLHANNSFLSDEDFPEVSGSQHG